MVRGRNELQDALRRWSQVLSIGGRFRCVRRLKILGGGKIQEGEGVLQESPGATVNEQDEGEGEEEEEQDDNIKDYFEMHDFCKPSKSGIEFWEDDMPLLHHEDYTETWQPLADFIGQLAGLQDLVWAYADPLPPCILSVVDAMSCRLHMHNFCLNSLIQHRDYRHDIDPDEFALATSTSLYSIVVPYHDLDSDGDLDYNREAVLRMVAGAAPRLAHVWMHLCLPENSIAFMEAMRSPKPAWSGFFPGTAVADEHGRGSLQSLFFDSGVSHTELSSWSCHTDFAKLRRITIHWDYESSDAVTSLQILGEIALAGGLKSLNTLVLSIPHFNARPMQDALIHLLEHLNPLDILDLTGFIGHKTLEPALIHHGGTLRKLRVIPYRAYGTLSPMVEFSEATIQRLVELCPNLEQVEFPINRTHSDGRETRIYRSLSALSRLKHVSLNLQFSVGAIKQGRKREEELQDDEEEEGLVFRISAGDDLPLADIQDGFNNGAIDSSLALSIFNLISSGGSLKHLRLQIERTRGPGSEEPDLNDMLAWIGRNWVCEQDDGGKVSVRELGKKKRMIIQEELPYFEESHYLTAWKNTWPQKSSNWWENWRSLPLSDEAEGSERVEGSGSQ
ncbi:hypothetical protein V495_02988 [Pseudogymnoascus sp. VKM F-4514 (FW-929)]|nr:hypothetical protein V495_02988 [Pseudogymnoascus sp. VKM F-4514 (FW-929)]KFY56378.1 hypothetical protein V497_06302 [Pseudogymnoascus sp. VKM F-4516 (FW-969)]